MSKFVKKNKKKSSGHDTVELIGNIKLKYLLRTTENAENWIVNLFEVYQICDTYLVEIFHIRTN